MLPLEFYRLLFFIFMAGTVFFICKRPGIVIGLVFIFYAFEQLIQIHDPFFVANTAVLNICFGLLILFAVFIQFIRNDILRLPYPSVSWLAMALYGLALASWFWSINPGLTKQYMVSGLPYIFTFVILLPLCFCKLEDISAAMRYALVFGGVTVVLLLLDTPAEVWSGRKIDLAISNAGEDLRGNPLAIGELGGIVALIAILIQFEKFNKLWHFFLKWALVLLGLIVVFKSGSRGQFLAIFIAVVAALPIAKKMTNIRNFIGAVCLIAFTLFAMFMVYQFLLVEADVRWDPQEMLRDFRESRIGEAFIALQYWAQQSPFQWLFGIGNSASFDPKVIEGYPHIVPVEVLVEQGVLGLMIYLLMPILVLISIKKIWYIVQDDNHYRSILAILVSLFVYFTLLSLKQGNLIGATSLMALYGIILRFESSLMDHLQMPELEDGQDLQDAGNSNV